MTVLLKDAIKPNLIQTLEGQPCLMHAGPFANIAHGNSSLIADLLGLKLGEYVVTESGFGSDMGMEKFFDIVCRAGGIVPSAVVLVATVRALKHHGGLGDDPDAEPRDRDWPRSSPGSRTSAATSGSSREFGVPAVVAVNRRPEDSDEEVELVTRLATEAGAFAAAVSDGFAQGGKGVADLAEAVVAACEQPNEFGFLYEDDEHDQGEDRDRSPSGYTAPPRSSTTWRPSTRSSSSPTRAWPSSRSAWRRRRSRSRPIPTLLGAPTGFQLPVRDLRAYTGAGWLVPLCGDIQQMPGLGKTAAAFAVDIDAEGRTVGLF